MSWENFMKGSTTFMLGDTPLRPKWCVPATISQRSGQTPLTSPRGADDAKNLQMFHALFLTIFIAWAPLGPSPCEEWTYWDHSQKPLKQSNSYWSPSTTSPSGSRQDHYEKSQPMRWRSSPRNTLYASTTSLMPSSPITTLNWKLRLMKTS